jgi:hypothetical protein
MLIRMVGQVSGLRNGEPWPLPGHAAELPDDEAVALIQNQMAVPAVDPETGVEIAVRDTARVEQREALVRKRTAKA